MIFYILSCTLFNLGYRICLFRKLYKRLDMFYKLGHRIDVCGVKLLDGYNMGGKAG